MANAITKQNEAQPSKRRRRRRQLMGADTGAPVRSGGNRLSALKQAAAQERHSLLAIGSAAALGLAERQNIKLPSVPMLGPAGTYGLGAYLAGRFTKNKTLEHVATGLLSVAAYKLTSGAQAAATSAVVGADEDEVIVGEF